HLVLSPVAARRRVVRCLPKWAIETAGVLHRVAENGPLLMAGLIQRGANRGDHTVPHPARREHVRFGLGMTHRVSAENVERSFIVDGAIPQHATGSMTG